MENNLNELHAIAWDKGCYMGQELTARMNYRGLVKKTLRRVRVEGSTVPVGTILLADGKEIGQMRTSNGELGLALVRMDFGGKAIRVERRSSQLISTDMKCHPERSEGSLTVIVRDSSLRSE